MSQDQAAARRIEDVYPAMARMWPGTSQEHVGEWFVRLGGGYTSRANSAVPVGDPGLPLGEAVDAVEAVYRGAGLPPRFQVPTLPDGTPHDPALEELLAGRGYALSVPALVMVADARPVAAVALPRGVELRWEARPSAGWLALASARFEESSDIALAVTLACPARYLTVLRDGVPAARGRTARDGDWFDAADLRVREDLRGQGLGRLAMAELEQEGARSGALSGVLQVEAGNTVARRLYDSLGWTVLGGYHFRTLG